jgi:beta-N-acetylhexosaminidase
MQALPGTIGERAAGALAAGCDVVLHCNGDMAEMVQIAAAASAMTPAAARRLTAGEARRLGARVPLDRRAARLRFAALMAGEA